MRYIIIVIILALTSCSDKIYNTTVIEGGQDTVMTIELSGGYTTYQAMDTVKYLFDDIARFYDRNADTLTYRGKGLIDYQYNELNIRIRMSDGSNLKGSIIKVRATSK